MSAERAEVSIAGEAVELFAERALYWKARRRLVIADLHLGKGEVFRKSGISLPSGGTLRDLARLSGLLEASGATQLWILGDVVHGPVPESGWPRDWHRWREKHPGVAMAAVPGNHDRALSRAGLGLELLPDRVADGPFMFQHAPGIAAEAGDGHVMCGHVHPVTPLPGLKGRWPSFWLRSQTTVLPAFSEFTGGIPVTPTQDAGVGICAGGHIVLVVPRDAPGRGPRRDEG